MRGIGTIVNVLAVLAGGGIGLLLKGGMKQRYQDIMMQALGLATIFVGIVGTLQGMLAISDGALGSRGTLLMVLSLTIGGIVGEFLNIEHGLEQFGEWLKKKVHAEQNARFVEAFVTTSLVVCVGAMAVVGSLEDGLITDLSAVGSVLICAVGINLLFDRGIKVGNMLPALLGPVVFHFISGILL